MEHEGERLGGGGSGSTARRLIRMARREKNREKEIILQ